MNKNKTASNIKLDISRKTVSFSNQSSGRIIKKALNDALEINDTIGEDSKEELYPVLGELKGLLRIYSVVKSKKQNIVRVDYHGINKERFVTFKNKYNQQVCLLLALLNAKDNHLLIECAYKILQDRKRCYHPPTGYSSRSGKIYQVVKNLRKRIGFSHKELYFNKKSSIIGLKALK